jgi:hypothetical protein
VLPGFDNINGACGDAPTAKSLPGGIEVGIHARDRWGFEAAVLEDVLGVAQRRDRANDADSFKQCFHCYWMACVKNVRATLPAANGNGLELLAIRSPARLVVVHYPEDILEGKTNNVQSVQDNFSGGTLI